jgi:cytochrome c553
MGSRPARIVFAVAVLAACTAASAEGQLSSAEALKIVQEGIAAQGVPACSSCHGSRGEGMPAQGAPRLAGLDADYLDRQLADFAAHRRRNAVMAPIASALTSPQRAALAACFAALPAAAAAAPAEAAPSPRGPELAVTGDWSHDVPACNACHGPGGEGVGSVTPPLVGQTQAYLFGQLMAFRSGEREGVMGLMNGVAARLSEGDLRAAATYYGSLPLPAEPPPGGGP